MLRSNFIGTVLVIVLGVNLGAWTLSVATKPGSSMQPLSIPIGAQAMDARSQSASVAVTQDAETTAMMNAAEIVSSAAATDIVATSSSDAAPAVPATTKHATSSASTKTTTVKPTLVQ
jgi:hypothetical protein